MLTPVTTFFLRWSGNLTPVRRGWALSEAERTLRHKRVHTLSRFRRTTLWVNEHPAAAAIAAHSLILGAVILGYLWNPEVAEQLTPSEPGNVLASAWQVHAGFVAIAFAGLAMLIDMAGRDALVRAVLERQALIRHSHFYLAFAFSLIGAIQLAVVSTWFATPGTVLAEIALVVSPAVALIGVAYGRAIGALTEPSYAERTAKRLIKEQLEASMDASQALFEANQRLEEVVEARRPADDDQATELLRAPYRARLTDVHLPTVTRVAGSLRDLGGVAGHVQPGSAPAPTRKGVILTKNASIGSTVDAQSPLFVAIGKLTPRDAARFSTLLTSAVLWERE
jgi:hypothetical protein